VCILLSHGEVTNVGLNAETYCFQVEKMQGAVRGLLSNGRNAILQHFRLGNQWIRPVALSRFESTIPAHIEEHGFEKTTISDILKGKGKGADGSWLWCTTDDTVYDAVKSVWILCFSVWATCLFPA